MTSYTFCTLFDKSYLHQGLALYSSIARNAQNFTLWILCMDEYTFTILERMQLPFVRLITLKIFETEELQKCKRSRTATEYCWTCKPALILHIFASDPTCSIVTYMDADLFFFDSPHIIYNAFNNHSIGITSHQFQVGKNHLEKTTGKYNAGFLIFRRDNAGKKCLEWYYRECLRWCYFRHEDGKIGDQGYLDVFPERFAGVYCFEHPGVNAGPWNITQYPVTAQGKKILVDQKPIICYHFHSFKMFSKTKYEPCSPGYKIRENNLIVYQLYYRAIASEINRIKMFDPSFRAFIRHKPSLTTRIKQKIAPSVSSMVEAIKKSKILNRHKTVCW